MASRWYRQKVEDEKKQREHQKRLSAIAKDLEEQNEIGKVIVSRSPGASMVDNLLYGQTYRKYVEKFVKTRQKLIEERKKFANEEKVSRKAVAPPANEEFRLSPPKKSQREEISKKPRRMWASTPIRNVDLRNVLKSPSINKSPNLQIRPNRNLIQNFLKVNKKGKKICYNVKTSRKLKTKILNLEQKIREFSYEIDIVNGKIAHIQKRRERKPSIVSNEVEANKYLGLMKDQMRLMKEAKEINSARGEVMKQKAKALNKLKLLKKLPLKYHGVRKGTDDQTCIEYTGHAPVRKATEKDLEDYIAKYESFLDRYKNDKAIIDVSMHRDKRTKAPSPALFEIADSEDSMNQNSISHQLSAHKTFDFAPNILSDFKNSILTVMDLTVEETELREWLQKAFKIVHEIKNGQTNSDITKFKVKMNETKVKLEQIEERQKIALENLKKHYRELGFDNQIEYNDDKFEEPLISAAEREEKLKVNQHNKNRKELIDTVKNLMATIATHESKLKDMRAKKDEGNVMKIQRLMERDNRKLISDAERLKEVNEFLKNYCSDVFMKHPEYTENFKAELKKIISDIKLTRLSPKRSI